MYVTVYLGERQIHFHKPDLNWTFGPVFLSFICENIKVHERCIAQMLTRWKITLFLISFISPAQTIKNWLLYLCFVLQMAALPGKDDIMHAWLKYEAERQNKTQNKWFDLNVHFGCFLCWETSLTCTRRTYNSMVKGAYFQPDL